MQMLPHIDFLNSYVSRDRIGRRRSHARDHREVFAATTGVRAASLRRRPCRRSRSRSATRTATCSARVPGHVCVRGAQVSGEYAGRSAAIGADGWLLTNDGGCWTRRFPVRDRRLDDVIVRGGENISPNEIEDVLLTTQPSAMRGRGMPDDEWGEVVVAAVVLADGGEVSESICRSGCVRSCARQRCRRGC